VKINSNISSCISECLMSVIGFHSMLPLFFMEALLSFLSDILYRLLWTKISCWRRNNSYTPSSTFHII